MGGVGNGGWGFIRGKGKQILSRQEWHHWRRTSVEKEREEGEFGKRISQSHTSNSRTAHILISAGILSSTGDTKKPTCKYRQDLFFHFAAAGKTTSNFPHTKNWNPRKKREMRISLSDYFFLSLGCYGVPWFSVFMHIVLAKRCSYVLLLQ